MMDKSNLRVSSGEKTAGNRGLKVLACREELFVEDKSSMRSYFCSRFSPHLFLKITSFFNKEFYCRRTWTSTHVDRCAFICRGAFQRPRPQQEEHFRTWPCGTHRCSRWMEWARSDPSVEVVGVRIRRAKWQRLLRQMNQPPLCERSVKEMFTFIHPSSSAANGPPCSLPTFTHTHSKSLIAGPLTQTHIRALHAAVTFIKCHTESFSPQTPLWEEGS